MSNTTRTVYGSLLQTYQYANLPFQMLPNSTLNEKFGVQSGVLPTNTPHVGYYAIGNGGHSFTTGANGVPKPDFYTHQPTDPALYKHLPFVLRATNNDLTAAQAAKYALRTTLTVGSNTYYAYYLKRLDLSSAVPSVSIQTKNNGTTSTRVFAPTSANLTPTPVPIGNEASNSISGTYAVVNATVPIVLTAEECQEIINAATILYGDPALAIISEIAICSGEDKSVPISTGSGTLFNEAVGVQVVSFMQTLHSVYMAQTGISGTMQIGSYEPMQITA